MSDVFKLRSLHNATSEVCPIDGVALINATTHSVRIDFKNSATQSQKDAANALVSSFDWSDGAQSSRDAVEQSDAATSSVDAGISKQGTHFERLCMATVLVALDAVNTERQTLTDMNTAVQAATSLADLKTRFAAITFPPQVTQGQLQTAVKNKLAGFPT